MRETRSSGSVEGVMGNHDSYSDCWVGAAIFSDCGTAGNCPFGAGRRATALLTLLTTRIH